MVLFVGLIPRVDRGRESFQEFDLHAWFGSTAKKVLVLDDADSAARVVDDAIHTARTGRPGPVVVGLPEDVLRIRTRSTAVPPRQVPRIVPDTTAFADRVAAALRPVIVVGGDGWDAAGSAALAGWAAERGIPVAADWRAHDAVPHDSPAFVGTLGYGRSDRLARLVHDADLHVFVGCVRTDVSSDGYTLGADTPTVVVGPDADAVGHFGRIDLQVVATVPEFVAALTSTTGPAPTARGSHPAPGRARRPPRVHHPAPRRGPRRRSRRGDAGPARRAARGHRADLRRREPLRLAGPFPAPHDRPLAGRAAQRCHGVRDPGGGRGVAGRARAPRPQRRGRRLLPDERAGAGDRRPPRRRVRRAGGRQRRLRHHRRAPGARVPGTAERHRHDQPRLRRTGAPPTGRSASGWRRRRSSAPPSPGRGRAGGRRCCTSSPTLASCDLRIRKPDPARVDRRRRRPARAASLSRRPCSTGRSRGRRAGPAGAGGGSRCCRR